MKVKICGLKTVQSVAWAADSGAYYIGLNFFPKSPRFVDLQSAAKLARAAPSHVLTVGLTVNMNNAELDRIVANVPLDILQLHGAETPERVREVRARYGLPVIKALGVADKEDLAALEIYSKVADQILVDAKPPKNADLPGGNGLPFDWSLIAHRRWSVPWMLAGGLSVDNVAEAIRLTGATQIDLSSGVESTPGVKDQNLIQQFMDAAKG